MKAKRKMKDGLIKRYENSYSFVINDVVTDPNTGFSKRRQRWVSVRGTREEAIKKRNEMRHLRDKGEFIAQSKVTVGEWLDKWLAEHVKRSQRQSTYTMYELIIRQHLKPAFGTIPLQKLRPSHISAYHAEHSKSHAGSTLQQHHAVISGALDAAVTDELLSKNVARHVNKKNRPKPERKSSETAKEQAWTAEEMRRFLAAAKAAGSQWGAFFTLAIDTGMRKGELCGLHWDNVKLDAGTLTVHQQLLKPRWEHRPGCPHPKLRPGLATCPQCGAARPSTEPVFGPTKSKTIPTRTLDISTETVAMCVSTGGYRRK